MPQAVGALARIAFVPETTWGTTPGSPSMKLLKAAAYGESLGMEIDEHLSQAINSNRSVETVRGGNKHVRGAVPFEAAALGFGTILKHALGSNTTTGAGPYTHTMKRGALPAGLSIEKGFTDIGQYLVYTGCKINRLQVSVSPAGIVTGSLDFMGKDMSASGTSLGTPTATTHTPFMEWEAAAQEGGSAATVLGFDFELTNALDEVNAVGSRTPAALTEGKGECMGNVSLMFTDLTAMNKWLNETASSLQIAFTNGANSLTFYFPNVRYMGDASPKIASNTGVIVPLKFRAVYDGTTELTDLKVTLVNTESSI